MLFLKEIREVLLSFLYLGLGSFTVSKETLVCGVDLVPYLYPFSIGGTMELAILRPPGLQEIIRLLLGPVISLWFPFLLFILWACCPDPTRPGSSSSSYMDCLPQPVMGFVVLDSYFYGSVKTKWRKERSVNIAFTTKVSKQEMQKFDMFTMFKARDTYTKFCAQKILVTSKDTPQHINKFSINYIIRYLYQRHLNITIKFEKIP